jgi:hypothetical protein
MAGIKESHYELCIGVTKVVVNHIHGDTRVSDNFSPEFLRQQVTILGIPCPVACEKEEDRIIFSGTPGHLGEPPSMMSY